MTPTTGTNQILNSSPIVERIHNAQNNQAQHASQYAGEQLAKKVHQRQESVPQSEDAEKVTIHKDPEEQEKKKRQAKGKKGESEKDQSSNLKEDEQNPLVKHIDIRV